MRNSGEYNLITLDNSVKHGFLGKKKKQNFYVSWKSWNGLDLGGLSQMGHVVMQLIVVKIIFLLLFVMYSFLWVTSNLRHLKSAFSWSTQSKHFYWNVKDVWLKFLFEIYVGELDLLLTHTCLLSFKH